MAADTSVPSVKSATVAVGSLESSPLTSDGLLASRVSSNDPSPPASCNDRTTPQKKRADLPPDRDSDSSLSEFEGPDSEAETERLHISPQKQRPTMMVQHMGNSGVATAATTMPIEMPASREHHDRRHAEDIGDDHPTTETSTRSPSKKRKRPDRESPVPRLASEDAEGKPAVLPPPKKKVHAPASNPEKHTQGQGDATTNGDIRSPKNTSVTNGKGCHSPEEFRSSENGEVAEDNPETPQKDEVGDGKSGDVAAEDTGDAIEGPQDDEDAEREFTKQKAVEELAEIERIFAKLKDSIYNEKLRRVEIEMKLLMEGTHPEYVAQKACIDQRLEEKVRLANAQYKHAMQSLDTATHVNRAQLHSQYFQTTRQLREDTLYQCSELWHNIQRERRAGDVIVPELTYRLPERQSVRIKERMKYNWEVQILGGVQRHFGFPAAPDVTGATEEEKTEDFELLGIAPRAVAARPLVPGVMRLDERYERSATHNWPQTHFSPPSPAPHAPGPLRPHQHAHVHHHHHHHRSHANAVPQAQPRPQQPEPPRRAASAVSNAGLQQPSPVSLSSLLQPPNDGGPKGETYPAQSPLPPLNNADHYPNYPSQLPQQQQPPYHPMGHHVHAFGPANGNDHPPPPNVMDVDRPAEPRTMGRDHDIGSLKRMKEEPIEGIGAAAGGGLRRPLSYRPGSLGYS